MSGSTDSIPPNSPPPNNQDPSPRKKSQEQTNQRNDHESENQSTEKKNSLEKEAQTNDEKERYTFCLEEQKKTIKKKQLYNDYRIFYQLSFIFQQFVRIQDTPEYNKDKIIDENTEEVKLEKSLPLIPIEDKVYLFSNSKELNKFYNKKNLTIESIKYFKKSITNDNLDNISEIAIEEKIFDTYLQVDTKKIENVDYVIDGKINTYQMKEGITEKDRIDIIRSKTYNNKKFVNININKKNEVNATISIKGDDDAITDFVEISNSSITTKNFLNDLQKKYRNKKLSIEDAEKAVNLIDIKNDKDYLKINNLKLIQLSTQDNKLVVSETNTIDDALEKLYPKGSEDIFFISNGELLTDKKISFSKCSKNIQILNIKEKKITLKFLPEDLQIDPILIDKDNIKIMKSLECLKKEIIRIAKINRDIKFTINKDEGIKITDKMLETNKITITLNVTFKPAIFKIKTADGSKKNISFTNETIRCLEEKYDCDKIQLFDDGQALEDDTKFINLTPSKTYKISLFDKFFLSQPKFEKLDDSKGEKYIISEKETIEVYLKRFETYSQYVDDKFKDIPFLIFKGTKNITDQQVDKKVKTSKDEPLILKINYEFRTKEGIKPLRTTCYTLDKYDTNIIKFIADKIFLSSANRVEAILNINNETKKKIKDNDKFNSLNYKKGYAIEATLLPPNLEFKIDQTDLNNIQINDENLPESFEKSFPPETTVEEAKKIICNELKIANNILFETKDRKLEDNDLMFEIPESSFITIKLLLPAYTFNFKGSDKVIKLKTNLTFSTALKELKDKKIIKLQSKYHGIEFYIKKEGKETVLDNSSKIVDIYGKGKIFCRELDPSYSFIYEKKKVEIRIPDNTNFKDIRNYVKKRFEQLKDIQSSRIKFSNDDKQYKNKDKQYKNEDIINEKCSENRKINIKLLSPKYNFEFDGEKIPLRLEEERTVKEAIKIVKDKIKAKTFDIKLKQGSDELKDDQVLFDQNLYDKELIVEKIPLMFHFRLNDSEETTSLRFYLDDSGDSAETSFKDIYNKKCIRLHEDLINFDLLDHRPTKDVKIPPIERFVITNENNEEQKHDNKFLSIINNNKEKIIGIKLLPPKFIFKMRNDSKVVREIVERGKKVKDIKEKISQKLRLGKYDFIVRINGVQLKDDDSFDNYEQDEKQTFIIHIQNPLYTFILNIDSEKSSSKKFRMSPYTTIQEVKSIILPQISSKCIDISIKEDVLNDTVELATYNNNDIFTIFATNKISLKINLPKILNIDYSELLIYKNYDIKKIKEQLIEELMQKSKIEYKLSNDQKISLYLSGKKLKDETKYADLIFLKGDIIECKFVFEFQCSKESTIKFEHFEENLDEKITIYQCKKKCLDHINKTSDKKIRNIARIDLKFKADDADEPIKSKDDETLFKAVKGKQIKCILVTVKDDEPFTKIKSGDKKFYNEMDVHEIREALGNNFIIKSDKTVIYDDMPLFTIPGEISTKEVDASKDTKKINIEFLDIKKRERDLSSIEVSPDINVLDLKKIIYDKYIDEEIDLNDINVLIKPESAITSEEFPKDYPLLNKEGKYRILCDKQVLFTIEEEKVYVSKKIINKDTERIVVLFYIKNDAETHMNFPYNDETTIKDLAEKIEYPKLDNTKKAVLYMGRIQDENSKLIDIIIDDNINFYIRLIPTLSTKD